MSNISPENERRKVTPKDTTKSSSNVGLTKCYLLQEQTERELEKNNVTPVKNQECDSKQHSLEPTYLVTNHFRAL